MHREGIIQSIILSIAHIVMSYVCFKYHNKGAQQKCTVHTFKKFNKDTFAAVPTQIKRDVNVILDMSYKMVHV